MLIHRTPREPRTLAAISGLLLLGAWLAVPGRAVHAETISAGTLKPAIQGLIDRQGSPPKTMTPYVHAYVVKVNWADLQPVQGGPIVANNPIDVAIARVNRPDYAALGMVLKLRVFAGVGAPDWAKSLGGDPIPYYNPDGASGIPSGTIGRFWTPEFGAAYTDLQTKLAAQYDAVPQLREVTVSRCTTFYDEPFTRQFGDKRNIAALLDAGYTTAADEQCILDSIATHDVWQQTRTDVAFNPYPLITRPNDQRDLAFTNSVMAYCRTTLGERCGLENNSMSSSKLSNNVYLRMYAAMSALGPNIVIQTAQAGQLGTPQQVMDAAVAMGANSIELPKGYPTWPTTMLAATSASLLANPVK